MSILDQGTPQYLVAGMHTTYITTVMATSNYNNSSEFTPHLPFSEATATFGIGDTMPEVRQDLDWMAVELA